MSPEEFQKALQELADLGLVKLEPNARTKMEEVDVDEEKLEEYDEKKD